jgi:hypothetical protein
MQWTYKNDNAVTKRNATTAVVLGSKALFKVSNCAPLFSHFQCTRGLLEGYVGAQLQTETVAWRKPGAMEKFCGKQPDKGKGIGGKGIGGAPTLPADATAKQEYLDVRHPNAAAEESAVVRHGALPVQRLIRSRITDDEAGELNPLQGCAGRDICI